mmetsp:Transcript_10311/g.32683  ORF Transcript_10311/g.32683 Transcript_10311/m.32683 type:complete len:238 (-) Transcript_10311:452-1165(-)
MLANEKSSSAARADRAGRERCPSLLRAAARPVSRKRAAGMAAAGSSRPDTSSFLWPSAAPVAEIVPSGTQRPSAPIARSGACQPVCSASMVTYASTPTSCCCRRSGFCFRALRSADRAEGATMGMLSHVSAVSGTLTHSAASSSAKRTGSEWDGPAAAATTSATPLQIARRRGRARGSSGAEAPPSHAATSSRHSEIGDSSSGVGRTDQARAPKARIAGNRIDSGSASRSALQPTAE